MVGARVRLVVSPFDAAPNVTLLLDGSPFNSGDEVVVPFGVHTLLARSNSVDWLFDSWNDGQYFDPEVQVDILADAEFNAVFSPA